MLSKTKLIPKPLLYYAWKEYRAPRRSDEVEDESIYDFISRRIGSEIAENLVDPVIKGVCGGDIKEISAASLLESFYNAERDRGSIIKGVFNNKRGLFAYLKIEFFVLFENKQYLRTYSRRTASL